MQYFANSIAKLFPDLTNTIPIGKGGFGEVFYGRSKSLNANVAIKVIVKPDKDREKFFRHLDKEMQVLRMIDHPFCIHYYGFFQDESNCYIIQEFAPNQSLREYLNHNGKYKEEDARRIFCQLLSILRYLNEELLIVHRDLKLDNILFDEDRNIRLIDFGLSTYATRDETLYTTCCGTMTYMAPEIIEKKPYTASVDMWSAGVILYTMITGSHPFSSSNATKLRYSIIHDEPKYPSNMSPLLLDFLKTLLNKNPAARPTAAQAVLHPWISESKWSYFTNDMFLMDKRYKVESFNVSLPKELEAVFKTPEKRECAKRILVTRKLNQFVKENAPKAELVFKQTKQAASPIILTGLNMTKRATLSSLNISSKPIMGTRTRTRTCMLHGNCNGKQTFLEKVLAIPVPTM